MKRRNLILLLLLPLFSFAQQSGSKQFSIQKLSDGVYAAIATNGSHAICNAGIIDLGNATLIFDPFMTPEAAEDLKKAAEQLTGHQVKCIVLSHYHNDHIGGCQVFPGALIISTEQTRDLIAKYQPEEIADDKLNAPKALARTMMEDTSKMTAHEKEEHIMWMGYYEALVTSSDSLKVVLPDKTFTDEMMIQRNNFPINLISHGTGHTPSDLILYLPQQKIVFAGDLLFINNQPWLGDGNPDQWSKYLDQIALLHPKTVVPGHGPLGTTNDFNAMKEYFKTVKDTATAYHQRNMNPENEKKISSPAPYNGWFLSNFFRPNVIGEYQRLFKKQGE